MTTEVSLPLAANSHKITPELSAEQIRGRSNSIGYAENRFQGKQAQMKLVCEKLKEKGFIPTELIENEVIWFYNNLGIDDMYFSMESIDVIISHILSLYGSKIMSFSKNSQQLDIYLERESEEGAVYMHTSKPGVSQTTGPQVEKKIDLKYLDKSTKDCAYRLETYRSTGIVSSAFPTQLRCYFVSKCNFGDSRMAHKSDGKIDIRSVADMTFLEKASENTLCIYEHVVNEVVNRNGPVIEVYDSGDRQKRLVIGFYQQTTQFLFSALSDLYHYYNLFSSRKYVEQFSNGVSVISVYLNETDGCKTPIDNSIQQIMKEASLMYCLPTTPLQKFFQEGKLSVQETIYGYAGLVFAQHFLNRLGSEYAVLAGLLNKTDSAHTSILSRLKKRLRQDTFNREYVLDIVRAYPELVRMLYVNFALTHYVSSKHNSLQPSLSFQRIVTDKILTDEEILEKIRKTVSSTHEFMVFEAFHTFNRHLLKTNFYQPTKVALSFRLDPSFLPEQEYATKLFGMFLVIGSEFRGFHLRFRDIARGGIRIIQSRNKEAYSANLRSLFDENYSLANTQQRKNKDIPEGGSKGTILMDFGMQEKSKVAFTKYVDSMLDLLLDGQSAGVKEKLVDLYGKQEILFFGPDEGTADFMDWASLHAKKRGMKYWKAFTTGKSQSLGGIPHDTYGMTTRSVHQYVLGIYRKLGLQEESMTKVQTGGPDGDLGSNEIKISKDKTIAIVDGSGVLYDLEGINRAELSKLALMRKPISHFDTSKLSKKGFRILVEENDVKLFDGKVIENGLKFRNEFHLSDYAASDVFVPCGGRPEAVDIANVASLFTPNGVCKFKYIVEGANLFFTQEARLHLENAGVVIFKDASANKGGVTSSSLEVLAALSFTDEEFQEHMQVTAERTPKFYEEYVKTVQNIIEKNAELEFECLWREHRNTNSPRSLLSDQLSNQIVQINEELRHTSLWDNEPLRKVILSEAIPKLLVDKLGLDTILKRIPDNYARALFGSFLASRFVYQYGNTPSQFAFFEFIAKYFDKLEGKK